MPKFLHRMRIAAALCLGLLIGNPFAGIRLPPLGRWNDETAQNHRPSTFTEQALALEAQTSRAANLASPRQLCYFRRQIKARRRSTIYQTKLPDDVPRKKLDAAFNHYEQEPARLKSELHKLAKRAKGFLIPPESIAPLAYDDQGRLQPLGLLGVLATPPDSYQNEFERLQSRFRELLADAVSKDVPEDRFYQEFGPLLANLDFLNSFHLTLAGIRAGRTFRVTGRAFDRLWREEIRYAKETVRYRQAMEFQWDGDIAFLKEFTPCIAALLMPSTREDLSRFSGFKLNFGNRMPERTEMAHVTLVYVRGIRERDPKNPEKFRRRVKAQHLRWIEKALSDLEKEQTQAKNRLPLKAWRISDPELRASRNVEQAVRRKAVPLIESQKYRDLIELGKKKLAKARGLSGPRVFDGDNALSKLFLSELDTVRGLFRRVNLRNARALFAAIGDGNIKSEDVLEFIRHGQKIHCEPRYVDGRPLLRVTATHDQPGLLLAISRKLDRSKYAVLRMSQSNVLRDFDPPDAIVALDIEMDKGVPPRHLVQLKDWLSQIPDIGHKASRRSKTNPRLVRTAALSVNLPRRTRVAGLASQRTRMLEGLRKLYPNASVISLQLVRDRNGSHIRMKVEVPKGLVDKLPPQLSLAVGVKGAASFEKKKNRGVRRLKTSA